METIRLALRQLGRSVAFTTTVILTLSLAIGVNTAVFSVVNALLLRSLPYYRPQDLSTIYVRTAGTHPSDERASLDYRQWTALQHDVSSLETAIYAGFNSGANLKAGQHVEYVHAARVSAHFLDVIGVSPFLGRNIAPTEDQPHGNRVTVLSFDLWQLAFGGDANVIGQQTLLKGVSYTVVGILPRGVTTPLNADLYIPLQASSDGEGAGSNFDLIARLRPGATWQEANAQINRAWASLSPKEIVSSRGSITYYCVPLQKAQTALLRPRLVGLMLACGFILLIACANLAGLCLVRLLKRRPEMATRLALGASRWQLQKLLWVENLILGLVGGAAGLGAGVLALRVLVKLLPEHFLPVYHIGLDKSVLLFTLVVSIFTCILFGVLPALTTRDIALRHAVQTRGTSSNGSVRVRQALIAGEVALTVLLLLACGLLTRTLMHFEQLPPGFSPDGVLAAKASLDEAKYHDPSVFQALINQSVDVLRAIPGVSDAAVGLSLPYERGLNDSVTIQGGPRACEEVGTSEIYVTPGYFGTLQIPLLAGRTFSASDGPNTQKVVIVNRTFAKKFYGTDNPVGRSLSQGMLIVGVVGDTEKQPGLGSSLPLSTEETIYLPASQFSSRALSIVHVWFQPSWIVRTAHPIAGITVQMRKAMSSVAPDLPLSGFSDMRELMGKALTIQRTETALLAILAILALLLSIIGVFVLISNMVAQRTREIGIRMALGSSVTQAMFEVGRTGATAVLCGCVVGTGLSLIALQGMRSILYGVDPLDPATLSAVILILVFTTGCAIVVPALRIAAIDPARTLREE